MKRLIINADDFGSDRMRNEGIIRAVEAGVVTSVSVLANGPAFTDVVDWVRSVPARKISFGVHLNITQGQPVAGGLTELVDERSVFLGKKKVLSFLGRGISPVLTREIEKEIESQIEALLREDIAVDHIDSHHHVHIFPGVIPIVMRAARRHGIPSIRVPGELLNSVRSLKRDEGVVREAEFFSNYAFRMRPSLDAWGLSAPDYFRGLYVKGRLSPQVLMELVENLDDGLTELMVHPGIEGSADTANPFTGFSTVERKDELEALLDERFRSILDKRGVTLVSYREVQRQ